MNIVFMIKSINDDMDDDCWNIDDMDDEKWYCLIEAINLDWVWWFFDGKEDIFSRFTVVFKGISHHTNTHGNEMFQEFCFVFTSEKKFPEFFFWKFSQENLNDGQEFFVVENRENFLSYFKQTNKKKINDDNGWEKLYRNSIIWWCTHRHRYRWVEIVTHFKPPNTHT